MSRIKKQPKERDNRTSSDAIKTTEMLMLLGLCVSANPKMLESMGPAAVSSEFGLQGNNSSFSFFANTKGHMTPKSTETRHQVQPVKDVHSARKQKSR